VSADVTGPPGTYAGSYAPADAAASPVLPPEQAPAATPGRSAGGVRRRSTRGLILAVLVVLLGGLLGYSGATMLTRHSSVLAVTRDVPIGSVITAADLTVASVSTDPNVASIPASQQDQIVGLVARVGLVKGELLTRAQVGANTGFEPGQVLAALPLKPGQFPAVGVTAGQRVLIVATPGSGGTSPTGSSAGESDAGIPATVADVGAQSPVTLVTVVDVRVPSAEGAQVARLASTGNLAVLVLPPGR